MLNLTHLITKHIARRLAKHGHKKRKRSVHEVAQQIRRELGLPPHPSFTRAGR